MDAEVSRRAKWFIGTVLGVLFLFAALAPLMLMTLRNPVPVKVADPAAQLPGTYVETERGYFHVFQRAELADTFPADAFEADPGVRLWVKYKALDALEAYGIYSFGSNRAVAVIRSTTRPKLLEVSPTTPLAPGRYYMTVSRDGAFGGTDYVYFRVRARVRARASATSTTGD